MRKRLFGVVAVGLLVVAGFGCSSKKKPTAGTEAGAPVEEGLGGAGSLQNYQQGRPLAGEEGPLRDIHFAFDSAELDEAARSTLRQNGQWLQEHTRARVEIEGHCDERGTVEYNLALGAKRAKAAKDYLATLGASSERLNTISYGEELPLCSEHNESCWQRNRRVHFVVTEE